MPAAVVTAIASHLPPTTLSNADLSAAFPDWPVEKIGDKTGILSRHVAAPGETAADLAVLAARTLFAQGRVTAADIDFVLLCTQSPDHFLPTSACLIQNRLGIPTTSGALDYNLGCSGFVYGLGLGKALVESGQARRLLLLTAETYTKYLAHDDRSTRSLFGDAACATLIEADARGGVIGAVVYGTDGAGGGNLIAQQGGHRCPGTPVMYMNGPEIFNFTLRAVPACMRRLCEQSGVAQADIDLFVFHQANQYMLEHLRKKLGIPAERFAIHMSETGNTGSATIPLVLEHLAAEGRLLPGMRVCTVGFGVGYSWGAALLTWR